MEKEVKMKVMQPTVVNVSSDQNVASGGLLCRSADPLWYKNCSYYNSDYCRRTCDNGPKEVLMPDVNLDYTREDGK